MAILMSLFLWKMCGNIKYWGRPIIWSLMGCLKQESFKKLLLRIIGSFMIYLSALLQVQQQISNKIRSERAEKGEGDRQTSGWMDGQKDEQKLDYVHFTSNCTISRCKSLSLKHKWQQLINQLSSISMILCMLYDVWYSHFWPLRVLKGLCMGPVGVPSLAE